MALTTTPGSATADSYVTLAEASTRLADDPRWTAWEEAPPADREAALRRAARRLEEERWVGTRVSDTQALAWPRADAPRVDAAEVGSARFGWYLLNEIPAPLQEAQVRLAAALLLGTDEAEPIAALMQGLESLSLDGLSLTAAPGEEPDGLPTDVARVLRGLRLRRTPRLRRG